MTTQTYEPSVEPHVHIKLRPHPHLKRFADAAKRLSTSVGKKAVEIVSSSAKPAVRHASAHAYSICGLGLLDAAAFTHSVFTGLIVTGVSFLLFEWKVGE